MQDLNDMLFFAEVVESGGFAAAGRRLGVPKSRLSRRVAELEARLGVRLLHRTTRKLSLTEAGEIYRRHCLAVREQAEAAEEAVAQVRREPHGTVRIACPVTLAQGSVGPLLHRFLDAHPQVRLEMLVTNRVVDLVQEGVDVALRVRASVEDSGSLVVKRLGPTTATLVAAPSLLARVGAPAAPADLARVPTVAMSSVDGNAAWRLFGPRGEPFDHHHRPRCTVDDLIVVKQAVVDGVGMGILPDDLCADALADGRLVPVLPGWSPAPALVLAVFPTRRGMVPAVRRLLDFLGEHLDRGSAPVDRAATR